MSLLFDGEQAQDQPAWTEPTLGEHETALDLLRQHKSTTVAGGVLRSFERAEEMYRLARALEYPLLVEIVAGRIASVAAGVTWVEAHSPAWFPASKMVAIMIARAGGTPALLRAAAIKEAGSG